MRGMLALLRKIWAWRAQPPHIEPFRHESATKRRLKYVLAYFAYVLAWIPIGAWVRQPEVTGGNPVTGVGGSTKCGTKDAGIILAAVFAANVVLEQVLAFKSKTKFQKVVPRGPWELPDDVDDGAAPRAPDPDLQYEGSLSATTGAIRDVLDKNSRVPGDVDRVAEFLRTAPGREFLREAHRGVKRFRILDGKLVRKSRFKHIVFFMASNICCLMSVLAALQESSSCGLREVSLNFLEFLSITLLTLIAITTFSGIQEYAMLFVAKDHIPITDDEKFLISLVAANADFEFSGIQHNEYSGYARVRAEGPVDAFVALPPALCVYGKANRDGDAELRAAEKLGLVGTETEELVSGPSDMV